MINRIKAFAQFRHNAGLNKDEIISLQNKKLRETVRHAYETTAFYKKWMDNAGVKSGDINTVDDLHRIPPITKSHIQNNFSAILSDKYKVEDCLVRTTSGSSGKILRVVWDQFNFLTRMLLYYRCFTMIGYNPFRKIVYFLPVVEDTGFNFGLFRQKGITLDTPFDEVKKILIKYKPHILSIYPSFAVDLADCMSDKEIEQMKIRAISLNSEMILPSEAARIKDIFKCPVYEEYSSVEFGMIAGMCRENRMHVFSDNVILEILDENGRKLPAGEPGEVVLTSLNSFAMPFIRYRIGDYSTITEETCSCGLSFPTIGRIEGRKDDSFILKDGRRIPAWQIYEIVERPLEEFGMDRLVLRDFYLVQKDHSLAEFFFVRGGDFRETYIEELKNKAKELFGNGFVLKINELNDIQRVRSAKRKYIHREIAKS